MIKLLNKLLGGLKKLFNFLALIRSTLLLLILCWILWRDVWTVSSIMSFFFLSVLYLAEEIRNSDKNRGEL